MPLIMTLLIPVNHMECLSKNLECLGSCRALPYWSCPPSTPHTKMAVSEVHVLIGRQVLGYMKKQSLHAPCCVTFDLTNED